jgi:hypothetical protein
MKKRYLDGTYLVPKIPNFPISEWLAVNEPQALSRTIRQWVSTAVDEEEARTEGGEDLEQIISLLDDMCISLGWLALGWHELRDCVLSPRIYHSITFTGNKGFVIGIVKRLVIAEEPNMSHLVRQLKVLWLMHCMKIGVGVFPQNWVNGVLVDAGETELYFLNRHGRFRYVRSIKSIMAGNFFTAVLDMGKKLK